MTLIEKLIAKMKAEQEEAGCRWPAHWGPEPQGIWPPECRAQVAIDKGLIPAGVRCTVERFEGEEVWFYEGLPPNKPVEFKLLAKVHRRELGFIEFTPPGAEAEGGAA